MWEKGRQGTGYLKRILFQNSFSDCYLIKYPDKTFIPKHVDNVDGKRHFRLNIVLKKPLSGGIFKCEKSILHTPRIILFRPDKYSHELTPVEGERLVFSLGLAI